MQRPGATQFYRTRISALMFQSSPGAKTGCNGALVAAVDVQDVSILTRCKDRVQLGIGVDKLRHGVFQSSPGAKTGCNLDEPLKRYRSDVSILTRCKDRVQRAFKASSWALKLVSILTRCKDRVQRYRSLSKRLSQSVSILTRCKDRVQRRTRARSTGPARGFNPHPVQRPGATSVAGQ